jgi:hypothetical protein
VFVLLEKLAKSFFKLDESHIEGVGSLKETRLAKSQKLKIYGELVN